MSYVIRKSFDHDVIEVLDSAGVLNYAFNIDLNDIASIQNAIYIITLLLDEKKLSIYSSYITAKWSVCLELCEEILPRLIGLRRDLVITDMRKS